MTSQDAKEALDAFLRPGDAQVRALLEQVAGFRRSMEAMEREHADALRTVCDRHVASAANLLHYIGLRRCDIREAQKRLAELGLSSLGRAESHAMASVDAVLDILRRLAGGGDPAEGAVPSAVTFRAGRALLEQHTEELLGGKPRARFVRIMVTMPSESATDAGLVAALIDAGMDCARINCAHDGPDQWERMIGHIREAQRSSGRPCRVLMDLAGPKLRTGAVGGEPRAIHLRPARDALGRETGPALVWLHPVGQTAPPPPDSVVVPVEGLVPGRLKAGAIIRFTDTRGAKREMQVRRVEPSGVLAECVRSAYLYTGVELHAGRSRRVMRVGPLSQAAGYIVVHRGDVLLLTAGASAGRSAVRDAAGAVLEPAWVPCTLPEAIGMLKPGEPVWFDDGKIGGQVESVTPDACAVRITHAREKGEKLRGDKGINLPDSDLKLSCLTERDLEDMAFAASHADIIGLSFVRDPEDIQQVGTVLAGLGCPDKPIVVKIETRQAFDRLPSILLAAMKWPCAGVMIARGDLAVECGYERLAEVQEEVLWLCEAAHMPVIWATQVLETLARKGVPSRAEVTDAAMGERAECVMLNKGPHILDAVRVLDDILRRMQEHQNKKSPKLRALRF